jgi:hypothetical protein
MMISPMIWALLPLHIEFAFVGWMIQFAMGIAFWILPRFRKDPLRGNVRLGWVAFILVNTGIFLFLPNAFVDRDWLTLAGRTMEALGLIAFVLGHWHRIKPFDA